MGVPACGHSARERSTRLPNPPPQGGRERESVPLLTTLLAIVVTMAIGVGAALAQSTFTPREESPEEFPAGAGRDETFYTCTACHNFKLVAAQGLSRAAWDDSINLMTRRHNMPPLDGAERKTVLDYLEATYPPRAPASRGGWQNPFSKQ